MATMPPAGTAQTRARPAAAISAIVFADSQPSRCEPGLTRKAPLSWPEACEVKPQIEHALQYTHRRLHVRCARLHGPGSEARHVGSSPDGDREVLVPRHLPVARGVFLKRIPSTAKKRGRRIDSTSERTSGTLRGSSI